MKLGWRVPNSSWCNLTTCCACWQRDVLKRTCFTSAKTTKYIGNLQCRKRPPLPHMSALVIHLCFLGWRQTVGQMYGCWRAQRKQRLGQSTEEHTLCLFILRWMWKTCCRSRNQCMWPSIGNLWRPWLQGEIKSRAHFNGSGDILNRLTEKGSMWLYAVKQRSMITKCVCLSDISHIINTMCYQKSKTSIQWNYLGVTILPFLLQAFSFAYNRWQ